MPTDNVGLRFALFNEIGIIAQLNRSALDKLLADDLISSHFTVLNHLCRTGDGQTPQALASAFQVAKTTMSHTISGLVKHQLIELRPNPTDGRSKLVCLTDKGRQLREETIRDITPKIAGVLDSFSDEEISDIVEKLATVRKLLDEARG